MQARSQQPAQGPGARSFRNFECKIWAHSGGDGVAVLDEGVAEVEVAADQADGAGCVVREEGAAAPRDAVVRRQRPWRQQEADAHGPCRLVGNVNVCFVHITAAIKTGSGTETDVHMVDAAQREHADVQNADVTDDAKPAEVAHRRAAPSGQKSFS